MTRATHYSSYVNDAGDPAYSFPSITRVVCKCGTADCDAFSTGEGITRLRDNSEVRVSTLRRRLRAVEHDERHFGARATRTDAEGVVPLSSAAKLHFGGGRDWGAYKGVSSSLSGLRDVCARERLLIIEELRRRGVDAPSRSRRRWWERFIPGPEVRETAVVALVLGTVGSAIILGAGHLLLGFAGQGWGFREEYLVVWGMLTLIVFLKWMQERYE